MISNGIGSFNWTVPQAATQMADVAPTTAPVEAAPTPAPDATALSGAASPTSAAAPTTNPWPELERLGLVGAGNTQGGPIGQALSQTARQGLLDALTRLEAGGVTFERRRGVRIPGLMKKHVPQTAEQAVRLLERKSAEKAHLGFTHGTEAHKMLWGVDDVRTLDVAYGLGMTAATAEVQPAFMALSDLQAAGWEVKEGRGSADSTPFDTWSQLSRGRSVTLTGPGGQSNVVQHPDDLVTIDYMVTGKDHGLADRPLADALLSLQSESPSYAGGNDMYGHGPAEAYRVLAGQKHSVDVTFPERPVAIKVDRADFANTASIVERSKKLDALWQTYLRPVMENNSYYAGPYIQFCIEENQKFTPELRSAVTAHLVDSWENGLRSSDAIIGMVRRLEAAATDDVQLAWMTNQVASTARREGMESATGMIGALTDGSTGGAINPAEAERLRPLLFKMIEATHSLAAAVEGLDLVRIAVGTETEDQRLQLFTDIAARESDKTLAHTADDYRAVLVHRRPGEDLISAGTTFVRVLEILALNRQQDRAATVFSTLQDGMTREVYGKRSMDDILAEFGQNLTMARSIDDAMRKLARGSHGAPAGPASVETQDDAVVIGGIRVPRAKPGQE